MLFIGRRFMVGLLLFSTLCAVSHGKDMLFVDSISYRRSATISLPVSPAATAAAIAANPQGDILVLLENPLRLLLRLSETNQITELKPPAEAGLSGVGDITWDGGLGWTAVFPASPVIYRLNRRGEFLPDLRLQKSAVVFEPLTALSRTDGTYLFFNRYDGYLWRIDKNNQIQRLAVLNDDFISGFSTARLDWAAQTGYVLFAVGKKSGRLNLATFQWSPVGFSRLEEAKSLTLDRIRSGAEFSESAVNYGGLTAETSTFAVNPLWLIVDWWSISPPLDSLSAWNALPLADAAVAGGRLYLLPRNGNSVVVIDCIRLKRE